MTAIYIIGITKGDYDPWKFHVNSVSLASCKKEIMATVPKKKDARGVIYKSDSDKLEDYMKANGLRTMTDRAWNDYTLHRATHLNTISWDGTYKAWRDWKVSNNGEIYLISPDGTTRKVLGPLTYLKVPQHNTFVEVTYRKNKEYLDVSTANGITFKFTRDGSKCIEIWDVHTGEEVIYDAKEVDEAIRYWYSKVYANDIIPSLKLFLGKEKRRAGSLKG